MESIPRDVWELIFRLAGPDVHLLCVLSRVCKKFQAAVKSIEEPLWKAAYASLEPHHTVKMSQNCYTWKDTYRDLFQAAFRPPPSHRQEQSWMQWLKVNCAFHVFASAYLFVLMISIYLFFVFLK
jgi:hypothetical protein